MFLSPEVESAWSPAVEDRPLLLTACVRCAGHRLLGFAAPAWQVAWGDTALELVSRRLVGAGLGFAYSVPMIVVVFWPGRHSPSLYDSFHQARWVGWLLAAPLIFMIVRYLVTTRAILIRNQVRSGSSVQRSGNLP